MRPKKTKKKAIFIQEKPACLLFVYATIVKSIKWEERVNALINPGFLDS